MNPFCSSALSIALITACAPDPQDPSPKPAPASGATKTAQDPKQDAAADKVLADLRAELQKQGIQVDPKAQTVSIPCTMNEPRDPVEYVLIHTRGKRHEAVLITETKPSMLNAALLMLGLEPGKNAIAKEKEPRPTLEEIEKGVDPVIVTPPEGMEFWMTVQWQGADGKPVEFCIEDLLLDLTTQLTIEQTTWIYLGGRMSQLYRNEPEVYVADFEGNLISACYMSPENHLGTLKHERARDDQNVWLTDKCPDPGTKLQLVFHRQKPKLAVDREARLKVEAAARAKAAAEEAAKDKAGKDGKEPPKEPGKEPVKEPGKQAVPGG